MQESLSLRARFIKVARDIQGPGFPIWFRDHNSPNMAVLVPALVHWAKAAHYTTALAVFDNKLRRLQSWQTATATV